jgi:hypothetical protein
MSEHDLEAPDADAAEQDTPAFPDAELDTTDEAGDTPDEVDPADRAEQQRSVELGDDEYR